MDKIEKTNPESVAQDTTDAKIEESITVKQAPQHRILVVAPENEARDRLINLLEREDNAVENYDTTIEVVDYLTSLVQPEEIELISMIIVNWSLSDSTLKKLVQHLQQAPFSQIPVVALTDSPCIEINEAMMFLKHTAIVEKPVKTNAMLAVLFKFLLQPSLPSTNKRAESDYYNLLESNSLLELAIKNHNNTQEDTSTTYSGSDLN